jgi:hypothetical protein
MPPPLSRSRVSPPPPPPRVAHLIRNPNLEITLDHRADMWIWSASSFDRRRVPQPGRRPRHHQLDHGLLLLVCRVSRVVALAFCSPRPLDLPPRVSHLPPPKYFLASCSLAASALVCADRCGIWGHSLLQAPGTI